ncbi:hypothetical protein O2L01_21940 [Glycomyces lechevalierae]|uniref:Uncharacterized protein n=1 Tax=Glycomyces lechevalierae TaxID=256034 RepID=A0A9X3PLK2_9ACTN|nr:hypothetical protein [Glycomyces lechevalierae]MDA1387669.1 hypothetical protein [Glycomyces lechevalierae]
MTAVFGQQRRERRRDLVGADLRLAGRFVDVNMQPLEEGPVEGLVEILRHRLQQPPRIVQQAEQQGDRLAGTLHLRVADLSQALIDDGELAAKPAHLDFEPVLRPLGVPDKIEQVALLIDQSPPLRFQVPTKRGRQQALLPQGLVDSRLQLSGDRWRHVQRRVMSRDCGFHLRDGQTGRLAMLPSLPAAQEVGVDDAAPVLDRVEVEARAAVRAPQEPLERMVVNAFASARAALVDQHILHSIEQLLTNKRLMTPLIFLALEDDSTEIAAVTKHPPKRLDGDRPTVGHVLPRPSPQTGLGHRPLEILEPVAAGRVELEHHHYERRTLLIDCDGSHLTAIDLLAHVQVTKWRESRCATPRRLGCHLVSHVRP